MHDEAANARFRVGGMGGHGGLRYPRALVRAHEAQAWSSHDAHDSAEWHSGKAGVRAIAGGSARAASLTITVSVRYHRA